MLTLRGLGILGPKRARLAGWLPLLALSACAVDPSHERVEPSRLAPPYPPSRSVTNVSWDFTGLEKLRRAHGSDIWPCTWAVDGNLYCAWGDGGGFDGDSDRVGRVSLGFARITGMPDRENPGGFVGRNVWGAAPVYAENAATFGGKVASMISVNGVLYAYGSLWTTENTSDPIHHSGAGPLQTLIWSDNLGRSWQRASWSGGPAGSFLNFGENNAGALDSFVYQYYRRSDDVTRIYLKRVPADRLASDPHAAGVYEYLTGLDDQGDAAAWSFRESDAGAVFTDPNGATVDVVYDAPIGRFLLTSGHFPGGADSANSAERVGLFEGPHPWGPWSTIGYYDTWGRLGPESYGDYLGLRFPGKWISADGKTLWAVFSGLGRYDSFNLVKVTLKVSRSIPTFRSPGAGTKLAPGSIVTLRGAGLQLTWVVERMSAGRLEIARGKGRTVRFTVPADAAAGERIRVTLRGPVGSVYRDYAIAVASAAKS